jgi:signal transduction histidine kinase
MRELAPQHEDHWFEIYGKIALTGESARFENRADALDRWYDVYAFRVEAPERHQVAIIFNDITERKKAHEILERTVERRTAELRETIQQLETFSYSVVHDMRAPLRAMNSYAEMLKTEFAEKLDGDGPEYLQRIMSGAQRLDRLIQDVLQYSRIGRDELPMESLNLGRLLHDIIHQYPDFTAQKERIQIDTSCDTQVHANVAALTQVISNLLTNALKFMPAGRMPDVRVSGAPRGDSVRITVHDNGIGIAREYHAVIFGVFRRLHNGEYPGSGIGLSIVKKAVERMNGSLGLDSDVGRGSSFWVELPRSDKNATTNLIQN